jgi:hypothetical protein
MLGNELCARSANDAAEGKGEEDGVVQLPGNRDEVRNQIERHRQIRDKGSEEELVTTRNAPVTEEPSKEQHAVRHEARDCARVLAPTGDGQRDYKRDIDSNKRADDK